MPNKAIKDTLTFKGFSFYKEIAMLILTRRVGETLIINDNIKLTVLGVRGHQVRIGVDAPKDVSVHRQEIYEKIQQESPDKETFTLPKDQPNQSDIS